MRSSALVLCFLLFAPVCRGADPVAMTPGEPLNLAFSADSQATASFALSAGEFARVEVVSSEGKFSLDARTAEDRFLRASHRDDAAGREVVEIVVDRDETVLVEVSAARGNDDGGRVELLLAERRTASAEERVAIAADMALDDGDRLLRDGAAEALRAAIERYKTAGDLFQKAGNRRMVGVALDSTAWVHDLLGDKREALKIYGDALAVRRETGDTNGEIFTLIGMGLVYNYLGEVDKALENNEHALKLAREAGNTQYEANLLHNIGGLYWSTDEMQKALDYYRRALEVRKTIDDPNGASGTLNNIGDTYRRLGDYDRAMDYFREALEIRTDLGNKRGMAHSLHTMGLVHSARGEWQTARETYQRALDLRRETGDKRGIAFSVSGLSGANYALGNVDEAIKLSGEAITLWKEMGERRSLGESKWRLGLMLIDLDRLDDAKQALDDALEIARDVRDRTSEASARYGLARYERKKGNLDSSMTHIEAAIAIVESLRGKIASEELRASYLASVSSFFDFYISLQMELDAARPDSGFAARALETSERARARSLLDSLAAASLESHLEIDSGIAERERQLKKQIQLLDRQVVKLAAEETQATELALAQTRLDETLAEYQRVLDEIRTKDPRLSELLSPETLDLDGIQSLLDPETALLEFSLGQDESFVWAVSAEGLASARLPKRSLIDEKARSLYETLAARNETPEGESPADRRKRIEDADERWTDLARDLSGTLLSSVAGTLDASRLVVVADGALQYLPFSALPDPRSESGEPMIVRHEIVVLPSASLLPLLRRDRHATPRDGAPIVSIVADPVFRADDSRVDRSAENDSSTVTADDPNRLLFRSAAEVGLTTFPRLRFSRREADAISSFLEPEQVVEATDFSASLDAIDWTRFGSARVMHLATHGILNSRNPELSGLVFSLVDSKGDPQPGFLKLGDIYNLRLDADLVVLSACQTALGKEIRGEGLIGLTRGFMFAGASRVISSLWRVDDRATAELMKRAYRILLENDKRPSSALREAQLELRAESRWQQPYYWAAFTIQGDWK